MSDDCCQFWTKWAAIEKPCARRASVIPSPRINGIASREMAENGTSTVMLKGIFEQLAEGHELPKKLAQDLLAGMIESVTWHLKQGDRIRIGGLGTLEVRKREARTGRDPAMGEILQIAASKKVAFRPAKELKEAV
jgi:DNA-binding protein HU-beta